jgi:hypothetical protein
MSQGRHPTYLHDLESGGLLTFDAVIVAAY